METTNVRSLTTATFDEEVLAADLPVLVDFTAEWCGPCQAMEPILDELAAEQSGRLKVTSVDVDEHPDVARRYEVMSFPTFLVLRDGEVVHRLVGARGKARLLQELAEALSWG
jgi:thioredoxin 1